MPSYPLVHAQAGIQTNSNAKHRKGQRLRRLGLRLRGDVREWVSALAVLLLGLAGAAHAQSVGYQHFTIPDPAGAAVEVGVWYPTDAPPAPMMLQLYPQDVAVNGKVAGARLPLVVMSHGNGGGHAGHFDTALALAHAGYVAAALTHTGDNFRDQSRAVDLPNRPRQLKLLVDYMLSAWSGHAQIAPNRIGAFGFSAGGFTVLTLAGGEPNLASIRPHCAAHPDYYDCKLVARFPDAAKALEGAVWTHDARLKAVVAAAPAVGFTFGKAGLAEVRVPIQLWGAEYDHVLPLPEYASAVRADLPVTPDYRVVRGADHYDFLAPCSPALAEAVKEICVSRPGFDRAAFHSDFNREVVAFFDRTLK